MRWRNLQDPASYEMYQEAAAGAGAEGGPAGEWRKVYDPFGDFGGPFREERLLHAAPKYKRMMAEEGEAAREAQEAALRAQDRLTPEAIQLIAARVGKAAVKLAEDAEKARLAAEGKPAPTKKQLAEAVRGVYDENYATAKAEMEKPGMTITIALEAVQEVEDRAGIAGPSAAETRRLMKKMAEKAGAGGAAAGGSSGGGRRGATRRRAH